MFLKVLKPLHGWRAFIGEVAIMAAERASGVADADLEADYLAGHR